MHQLRLNSTRQAYFAEGGVILLKILHFVIGELFREEVKQRITQLLIKHRHTFGRQRRSQRQVLYTFGQTRNHCFGGLLHNLHINLKVSTNAITLMTTLTE